MIWGSIYIMTTIDLLIMAIGIWVGIRMFQNYKNNPNSDYLYPHLLIGAGLLLITLFFVADLISMWVMPQSIGMMAAMEVMEYLHLNISWVIFPLAISAIAYGFLGIQTDLVNRRITLEKLVEKRTADLHQAQHELIQKERLATLGQLTGTVSHELRNPLGVIRSALYVIEKMRDQGNQQTQNAIKRADRSIERCTRIIDELLDFSRISHLIKQVTPIDEWFESVIAEQTIPQGIQLEKNFKLKEFKLSIDQDRLRRAVINIVENACQSMLDDNQTGEPLPNSKLNIKTRGTDDRVEFVVSDNGTGMSESVLAKIFEPLFSTKNFGVGLGMLTVKNIMEQHAGGIEIDTRENRGTSVTLWLPGNTVAFNDDVAAA